MDSLLVQLVGPTRNLFIIFIFHSILYYYSMFNIWFKQVDDLFILVSHEDHYSIWMSMTN